MSDRRVRAAIEQMEAWLADANWEPDPEVLAQWNTEFLAARAQAEKSADWPQLIARAHAAGHRMEERTQLMVQELERVKAALEGQERGNRALKGYGANVR